MSKIIIIGPAHPLRGGIANFNHRLAREFVSSGHDCVIYSFSLQYPSFLFPGKTQYSNDDPPQGVTIYPVINSVNPLNWIVIGRKLKKMKPDLIIVRFWLPLMGPALGTILRRVRGNDHTKVICLADNIKPHEKRPGDISFTKYFIRSCHAFVTMSDKVLSDLRFFAPQAPAIVVHHPLFDQFGQKEDKSEARQYLKIGTHERVILFFGFIRRYKGLDLLLQAMADPAVKQAEVKLLIAGEFYEDEKAYQDQIDDLGIRDRLIFHTHFIPNEEVRFYVSAADVIVQPYRGATQSGVTPLAYHFEKPMIVTNVGGLPDYVTHEKSGLVTSPEPKALADAIIRFYELGEDFFIPHLRLAKQNYTWSHFTEAVLKLASEISPGRSIKK